MKTMKYCLLVIGISLATSLSTFAQEVTTALTESTTTDDGKIYDQPDELPQFPGGTMKMMKLLASEMRYPESAAAQDIQGRVIVQFVIETDGSISNIEVTKSVHEALDQEAMRIVGRLPKWTPGKVKGQAVRTRFALPIQFRLSPTKNEAKEEPIFEVVDETADFPGGMGALMHHLAKNIKYPKEAEAKGIQGRVIVQFIVERDGSISKRKVTRSVHPLLDQEALRVLGTMPNWTPAKQGGKTVRMYFSLPIQFRLPARATASK